MAAPANTSAFPEKPAVSKEKSQLPEDSDDEDVITSVRKSIKFNVAWVLRLQNAS